MPTTGSRPAAAVRRHEVDAGLVEPLPELPPGGRAAVAEVEVDRRGNARIAPCIRISLGVWDEGHATVAAPWSSRRLLTVLAALAAVRVGIAVAAAAAEGTKLPGIPPTGGEGSKATRTVLRGSAGGAGGLALSRRRRDPPCSRSRSAGSGLAAAAPQSSAWPAGSPGRRRRGLRHGGDCGDGAAGRAGRGVALLWAVPLAPLRIFGEPTIDAAWTAGVALSLACVAIATVACGLLGRWAPGRTRSVSARPPCSRRGRSSSARSRAGRHGRTAPGSPTPACTSTRSRSRRARRERARRSRSSCRRLHLERAPGCCSGSRPPSSSPTA